MQPPAAGAGREKLGVPVTQKRKTGENRRPAPHPSFQARGEVAGAGTRLPPRPSRVSPALGWEGAQNVPDHG